MAAAAAAAAAEESAMAGGGDSSGGGGGSSGNVIEIDPENDAARQEGGDAVSVENGAVQKLPDRVVLAFAGGAGGGGAGGGGGDGDSDEGLSRRRKSRERARAMGMLAKGKHSSSQSQSQSGDSLNDDGSGVKDGDGGGTRAVSARLREAHEREKAMQKEIEVRRCCRPGASNSARSGVCAARIHGTAWGCAASTPPRRCGVVVRFCATISVRCVPRSKSAAVQ